MEGQNGVNVKVEWGMVEQGLMTQLSYVRTTDTDELKRVMW